MVQLKNSLADFFNKMEADGRRHEKKYMESKVISEDSELSIGIKWMRKDKNNQSQKRFSESFDQLGDSSSSLGSGKSVSSSSSGRSVSSFSSLGSFRSSKCLSKLYNKLESQGRRFEKEEKQRKEIQKQWQEREEKYHKEEKRRLKRDRKRATRSETY